MEHNSYLRSWLQFNCGDNYSAAPQQNLVKQFVWAGGVFCLLVLHFDLQTSHRATPA